MALRYQRTPQLRPPGPDAVFFFLFSLFFDRVIVLAGMFSSMQIQ